MNSLETLIAHQREAIRLSSEILDNYNMGLISTVECIEQLSATAQSAIKVQKDTCKELNVSKDWIDGYIVGKAH